MPPQEPNPSLSSSKKINPPLFIWVLIITAALIGSFSIFLYSRPSLLRTINPQIEEKMQEEVVDQFANWKTYRNTKYNYEFKYPDGICVVNLSDIGGCAGTLDQHLNADVLLLADDEYELIIRIEGSKIANIYNSVLTDQILSTFKFIGSDSERTGIVVPPLFAEAKWQELAFDPVKNKDFMFVLDNYKYEQDSVKRRQSFKQLPGKLVVSTITGLTRSEFNDIQGKFMKYYEDSLVKSGWNFSHNIDSKKISISGPSSDGPLGSIWGYIKVQNDRLKLVGLGYQITDFVDTANGGPVEIDCPCTLELKVFISDEISIDQLVL